MNTAKQLSPASILFLKGDINYTQFYLCDGSKYLSCHTLKLHQAHFEGFLRISRSYLLNPEYIAGIEQGFGEPEVIMTNGHRVKVPRRKIKDLSWMKS